jgi:hypothetical protein
VALKHFMAFLCREVTAVIVRIAKGTRISLPCDHCRLANAT